jgi:hypothetical protein
VFELNVKVFSVVLVVLCFTAGVTGVYLGNCYFAHKPSTEITSDIETDTSFTPENQQSPQNIVADPTSEPAQTLEKTDEETATMHVYEFYLKEEITSYYVINEILDSLKQLGNYYCDTDWARLIPPSTSEYIYGVQIALYQQATQEQYAIMQQSSSKNHNIKYYTVEVPQYVIEAHENYMAAYEINPLIGHVKDGPVSYGSGIPRHSI